MYVSTSARGNVCTSYHSRRSRGRCGLFWLCLRLQVQQQLKKSCPADAHCGHSAGLDARHGQVGGLGDLPQGRYWDAGRSVLMPGEAAAAGVGALPRPLLRAAGR